MLWTSIYFHVALYGHPWARGLTESVQIISHSWHLLFSTLLQAQTACTPNRTHYTSQNKVINPSSPSSTSLLLPLNNTPPSTFHLPTHLCPCSVSLLPGTRGHACCCNSHLRRVRCLFSLVYFFNVRVTQI